MRRRLLLAIPLLVVAAGGAVLAIHISAKGGDLDRARPVAHAAPATTQTESEPRTYEQSEPAPAPAQPEPEPQAPETAQAPPPAPTEPEADPNLDRLANQVRQTKGFEDQADVVTFGLLYHHLKTGQAILPSVAMAAVDSQRSQIPYRHRLAGYLDFWQNIYGGTNWQRFPMDETRMLGMYDSYTYSQLAARQNRINQRLGAIVASEESWRGVMADIRARDEQAASQQYVSDLLYSAERSVQSAQTALAR